MAAIFLSYAREDRACAQALARALEQSGHEVWWDLNIEGGSEFSAEIEAALSKAEVVLVAWSKESVKSRWVRDEATVGGDTGRLLPVSIDGSQPPMGFRQFHTLDLTGWKGAKRDQRTDELLQSVERRLKGERRTAPAAMGAEPKPRFAALWRRPIWGIASALVLTLAVGLVLLQWNNRDSLRGPLPKPTIVLLPFVAPAAGPQLRDLAAQTRDSLSHTLSQTGMPVRMLNAASHDRRSGGDFLLSGELTGTPDEVVATVRLDEAAHGVTVATQRFEAVGDDVRNLPERIGAQMAAFFDGSTLQILDRRRPIDPSLMTELLASSDDNLKNYQIGQRAAAKAPQVAPANLMLAFMTGFALGEIPGDARPKAVEEARRAAEQAIKLAPEFGDAYATWCFLHSDALFAQCEDHIRAGNRVDPDAPFLNFFRSQLLQSVGRFDEAAQVTRLSYSHDRFSPFKIRQMLRMLEWVGDSNAASELAEKGVRWWPELSSAFFHNRLFGLIDRGDFDAMQRLEHEARPKDLSPNYTGSAALAAAARSKSVRAAKRACADAEEFWLRARCMVLLVRLGDADGAYALADKLYPRRLGGTPEETERIWLDDPDGGGPTEFITSPAAAPMRRDPRYLQLAKRVGLLDYWRTGRRPDFCQKQPEPVCARLTKPD